MFGYEPLELIDQPIDVLVPATVKAHQGQLRSDYSQAPTRRPMGAGLICAAGATVGGGVSVAYLKSEHGVVIKRHSTTAGLRFNLSADGVHITLRTK
jgi:hypothetical protein